MTTRLAIIALAFALLAGCAGDSSYEQVAQHSPRGPAYAAGSVDPMTGSFVGATGGASVNTFIRR
jgi:hypothetical protein